MDLIKSHPKEKVDMILEPLQVLTQLAVLSYLPVGTKISICNNILYLQQPTMFQGVLRWYQKDNKDDLYYLFHAIRRYYKWYKHKDDEVFIKILSLAIKGIEKLIETYNKIGITTITHTLNLYKNILEQDSDELFKDENHNSISVDDVFETITELYDRKLLVILYSIFEIMEKEDNEKNIQLYVQGLNKILEPTQNKIRKWILDNLTC
tara:strand:+ start:2154 stop:2777 length:624 start_codon:yes stop_codon:yes gene_type:complete